MEKPMAHYAGAFGLYTREESLATAREMGAKKLVFTHLEEDWGLSHGDYCAMEDEFVRFAFDGMQIDVCLTADLT